MFRFLLIVSMCMAAGAATAAPLHDPTRPPAGADTSRAPATERPAQPLSLSFIINSAERRLARVNQKWVAEGDEVAGARVERIGSDHVRLRRDGRILHVSLGSSRVSKRPADASQSE